MNTFPMRRLCSLLCHASLLAALPAISPAHAQTSPPPPPPPPFPVSAAPISLESLLAEMTDRDRLCRFPSPAYESLQASSYNRESTNRDAPGWFADGDGTGFIREEITDGRREWVLMEHQGPGCLTRLWTPYFYYDLDNHIGPDVRIYLDGASTPVINESLISLVTGKGSIAAPLASFTARAGDLYLPIPFAAACKVTMTRPPFYYIINFRAYSAGTPVESYSPSVLARAQPAIDAASRALTTPDDAPSPTDLRVSKSQGSIAPGAAKQLDLPRGPGAVRELSIRVPNALTSPAALRSTVLVVRMDGETCIWCPVGDFFCSADSIHPFSTWQRTVTAEGAMSCRWVMPYARDGSISLLNVGTEPVDAELSVSTSPWTWDDASMHFHAAWRPDDVVPGTPFQDWNYVDITGRGVYVGDAWTILNPQKNTWWGEGDEKIYVDSAWEKGFPTHFGTGTEDYYGWAGGEIPTRKDEFSHPLLANVRVGGLDGTTQGFNIVTRTRSLDAIPFTARLRFDMESSFGTDIREPHNHLGYSAVTFWYALPGATDNRSPDPAAAARAIMSLEADGAGGSRIRR